MSTQGEQQVLEKEEVQTIEPKMYNVILINDDYTPFEFVVHVLIEIFNKDINEAQSITQSVHNQGRGVAGTYVKDVADTKSVITQKSAKSNGFPLETIVEEA